MRKLDITLRITSTGDTKKRALINNDTKNLLANKYINGVHDLNRNNQINETIILLSQRH